MIQPAQGSRQVRHWLVVFGVVILGTAWCVLVLTKPISQDEGVFLTIGKYLSHGLLPYRDFFDHKPPGIYFLFAWLFKVFGPSIWVAKIALIASTFGASIIVGKISSQLQSGSGWVAAGLFLFLMTQFEGYWLIAEPFMVLCILCALWLLVRRESSRASLFLAGSVLVGAVLIKQTAILSVIPIIIFFTLEKKFTRYFLFGLITPVFLTGVYLVTHSIVAEAWRQVVVMTLTNYPRESWPVVLRALRWNFLWTLPVWGLFILGLKQTHPLKKILLWLVLLPLLFMFFRHYAHYWIQVLPFVAIIATIALAGFHRTHIWTASTLIFCLVVAGGKVWSEARPNYTILREQFRAAGILNNEPANIVLAENQFTAFYFLLAHRPLNTFLYVTEISDAVGAERRTIHDLQSGQDVLILWPLDPNYAYAKKLQNYILTNSTGEKLFPKLGMKASSLAPLEI